MTRLPPDACPPRRPHRRPARLLVSLAVSALTTGRPVAAPTAAHAADAGWATTQPGASPDGCAGVRTTVTLNSSGAPTPGATRNCAAALLPAPVGAGNRLVETITDGADGLVRTSRVVAAGQAVSIPVVANGGFAAQLRAVTAGRTTCDV